MKKETLRQRLIDDGGDDIRSMIAALEVGEDDSSTLERRYLDGE